MKRPGAHKQEEAEENENESKEKSETTFNGVLWTLKRQNAKRQASTSAMNAGRRNNPVIDVTSR